MRPAAILAGLIASILALPAAALEGETITFALPCDEEIAFSVVTTREGVDGDDRSILADTRIRLGSPDVESGFLDYLRTQYLEGPFVSDGRSFYLLGTHEVTVGEFKALTGPCEAIGGDDAEMPLVRVSWYEAVDFTRRLTVHLLGEEREALEAALGTAKAHARLPTEAEWEFAARGGLAVSVADFQAARFPMTTDLLDYAWFNDPLSADGALFPTGLLEPNPLGLYDVYGNAGEMMLEPFTLNKAGRSHGLAGGFIVKGGSFQEGAPYLTSAARNELPFVNPETGEEMRLPTVGFRVALGGLALPSRSDVDRLAAEWQEAGRTRLPQADDPLEMLQTVREDVADLSLASDLDAIAQAVRLLASQRAENAEQLLDGLLYSMARALAPLRERYVSMQARRRVAGTRLAPEVLETLRQRVRDDELFVFSQNELVHELVVRVANNFSPETVVERADALGGELRGRDLDTLAEMTRIAGLMVKRLIEKDAEITRAEVLALALSGL